MTARLVFMGTPEAAVPTLRALNERHEVVLVVTQPDRPKGRSKDPQPPPVKVVAHELGLDVAQPESAAELERAVQQGGSLDLGVVVAYGRILQPVVLEYPDHGLLNVHFSLLPRWRGAAPVARALMAGDEMTGTSIIRLDEGLDTGPVLTAQAIDIGPDVNAGELTRQLAHLGAHLLVSVIDDYLSGELVPVAQTDEGATYANKLQRHDRPIEPAQKRSQALFKIRGLAPDPAATLMIEGQPHKVTSARLSEVSPAQGHWQIMDGVPVVGFADGGLEILEIQPPGKTPLSGRDWANGRRENAGTLGSGS